MSSTASGNDTVNISSAEAHAEINHLETRKCLAEAEHLKTEGNEHFRAKRWEEALGVYRAALGRLPKRRELGQKSPPSNEKEKQGKGEDSEDEDTETARNAPRTSNSGEEGDQIQEEPDDRPLTELEVECAQARSILNANIGACYVKIGDHKEAVAACTQALTDNPRYIKALQRRAASNDQINTWSSLTSAQEDYNTLLILLPPSSPQIAETKRALASIKPRLDAAQKRETAEMLDKLKGLGNNILGNFGLSTDNFQFTPNGQGGYSMNFVK